MDFDEYDYLEKTVENPDLPLEEKDNGNGLKSEKDRSRSSRHRGDEPERDSDRHRPSKRSRSDYSERSSSLHRSSDRRSRDGGRDRDEDLDRHRRDRNRDREERNDKYMDRDRDRERGREKVRELEREEMERARRSRSRSERRREEEIREREKERELHKERDRDSRGRRPSAVDYLENMYVASLKLTSATFISAMSNIIPSMTFVLAVMFSGAVAENMSCQFEDDVCYLHQCNEQYHSFNDVRFSCYVQGEEARVDPNNTTTDRRLWTIWMSKQTKGKTLLHKKEEPQIKERLSQSKDTLQQARTYAVGLRSSCSSKKKRC